MSICVCKLICNLCKEHYMLENSCVTASFPFPFLLCCSFCSASLFLFGRLLTRLGVWLPQQLRMQMYRDQQTDNTQSCVYCYATSFLFKPHFLSPFMTLAHHKSGLQMTRLDRGEMANTPRQLERVMVRTSKEMCRLIWRRVYVDSCAGLQVWTELQTVETFRDSMNTCEAEVIKGAESRSVVVM